MYVWRCIIYFSSNPKQVRGLLPGIGWKTQYLTLLSCHFSFALLPGALQQTEAMDKNGNCSGKAQHLPPGPCTYPANPQGQGEHPSLKSLWKKTVEGEGFVSHQTTLGSSICRMRPSGLSGHCSCGCLKWGCSLLDVCMLCKMQSRQLKKGGGRGESTTGIQEAPSSEKTIYFFL